jgi:carbon monoxide dehydrogenase subunit G
MDMTGERRIAAPRRIVWDALNDPEVLKDSIPGCQSLEKLSDTQMKAVAAVKIGPISARFTGNVLLTDIDPPNGYAIGGEGQGGVAGFAKGGAKVRLEDDGPATTLRYEVHAQVGGKIAQLGARLIDATAKQMADQFFDRFSARVQALAPAEAATPVETAAETRAFPSAPSEEVAHPVLPPAHPAPGISMWAHMPREPLGMPMAVWLGGAAYILILLLFFGSLL